MLQSQKNEGISVVEYLVEYCTKRLLLHQLTASLISFTKMFPLIQCYLTEECFLILELRFS